MPLPEKREGKLLAVFLLAALGVVLRVLAAFVLVLVAVFLLVVLTIALHEDTSFHSVEYRRYCGSYGKKYT